MGGRPSGGGGRPPMGGRPPGGGFYGGPPPGGFRGRPRSGCGSFIVSILIFAVILAAVVIMEIPASTVSITQSTVERTKLDKQYTTSTDFYVDELGWIRNSTLLNKGLKSFYDETGVHPLLYITDTVNGTKSPTSSDMEKYSEELYKKLCPDEGHILLLFHCLDGDTNYNMWYTCGAQAKTVMDSEACDILMDYIDSYFLSNRSDDEMFADAFEDAGNRIMTKTTSPIVYVVICAAVIAVLLIAFAWWKKIKAQKNLEAKQTEEMLNKDLHTFSETGDSDLDDLENKYK
jgi:large-conductance mechanosensitive channel